MRHRLLLGVIAALAIGCSASGHFSVVSTKNLGFDFPPECRRGVFEGSDTGFVILGFPLGLANLRKAVDDALARGEGNVMVNAQVYHDYWTVILFGEYRLTVRGEVYRVDEAAWQSIAREEAPR